MKKINYYHFETIVSTNTWAKEHADEFSHDALTLVTADHQTGGRGRFKRHWESPKGMNIYATFCFFIPIQRSDIGHIPQLLALSAAQVIRDLSIKPKLKWPNDVLINGKKVAGILCETVMVEHLRCVVCGIGLNVNMPQNQLDKIDRPATSLMVEASQIYSVQKILEELTLHFNQNLSLFLLKGFDVFFENFKFYSYLIKGQKICFHDNQNLLTGFFESLNQDGTMTLKLDNGQIKTFYAGEFL